MSTVASSRSAVNPLIWCIVAGVVGAVGALGVSFGLVSAVGGLPPQVDKPYVVYGTE